MKELYVKKIQAFYKNVEINDELNEQY